MLIPYNNWKTLLFLKVYRYSEILFNRRVATFFKPVFEKKPVFYALSPE